MGWQHLPTLWDGKGQTGSCQRPTSVVRHAERKEKIVSAHIQCTKQILLHRIQGKIWVVATEAGNLDPTIEGDFGDSRVNHTPPTIVKNLRRVVIRVPNDAVVHPKELWIARWIGGVAVLNNLRLGTRTRWTVTKDAVVINNGRDIATITKVR
jgi:hypothetical protein